MGQRVVIIGGGAAGFFFAAHYGTRHPDAQITLLERSRHLLDKVLRSGGGRCNVTHACYDPRLLVQHYPRGERELLGAFHRFGSQDTVDWFAQRGIELNTEADGRMFPTTDSAATIADCLLQEAQRHHVQIHIQTEVDTLTRTDTHWTITTVQGASYMADVVFIAAGASLRMWDILAHIGYRIVPPVPSLFTFNIKHPLLTGLQGISVPQAQVEIAHSRLSASGPLLITHWGLSGPAVLRLSAWGARMLHEQQYRFSIEVNWLGEQTTLETTAFLKAYKAQHPRRSLIAQPAVAVPMRLWERMVALCAPTYAQTIWAELPNKVIEELADILTKSTLQVTGKSTFKEEFVTAGGVALDQIDFRTFGSRLHPNLYLAGEILDIDAITGGFNFQAAWTGAALAAAAC